MQWLLLVFGFGIAVSSVYSFFKAWQRKRLRTEYRPILTFAWMLCFATILIFAVGFGAETGIPFSITSVSIAGYIIVFSHMKRRPLKKIKLRDSSEVQQGLVLNVWRGIARVNLVLLSGVWAMSLGGVYVKYMPVDPVNRIGIAILCVPLIWGVGLAWSLGDPKIYRVAIFMGSSTLLSFAFIYLKGVF